MGVPAPRPATPRTELQPAGIRPRERSGSHQPGKARGRSQDERTSAPPAYALDPRRLRTAYLDLLGRPPFEHERAEWSDRGMADWLDQVLGGTEFWQNWLEEQLYYFLLIDNFRPRSERVVDLPTDLAAGRLGVRDALHRIVVSASFDRRNPGPDTFVTVVMEQLLGMTVQEVPRELGVGKRLYDGGHGQFLGRKGGSQADLVEIAIEDRRTLTNYLFREFVRYLRVEPSRRELVEWARRLEREPRTYTALLREWLLSERYTRRLATRRPLSNRTFVRALFVDLVDRLPDEAEVQRMRNALDGLADARPLRAVLARLLLDSDTAELPAKAQIEDPTQWVGGLYEHLLGRTATQAELKTFVHAFNDPACRPSTVVYALVSHPEYQTW